MSARSLQPAFTPDENACAREPIHIPGKIQPHGMLIAFKCGRISHFSANAGRLGKVSAGAEIGKLFPQCVLDLVLPATDLPGEGAVPLRHLGSAEITGAAHDLLLHRASSGEWVLELEKIPPYPAAAAQIYPLVHFALARIEEGEGLEEMWQATADEARRISRYDRVMVYRFDAAWNGTVVAESKEPELEPFLGLRYPASDIPPQARALYERNWIRAIPAVSYDPVGLSGEESAPLDLSYSALRSVSPVHLQYLKNMEVGASMSVSLMKEGRLWGLIAFHHREAKYLPFEVRQSLELLGRYLSGRISGKEQSELARKRLAIAERRRLVEERVRRSANAEQEIIRDEKQFLELAPGSEGGAFLRQGLIFTTGKVPTEQELRELYAFLARRQGSEPFYLTDQLSAAHPPALAYAGVASGILSVSVPESEPAFFVWLKPEVEQTVRWAGKPEKQAEASQALQLSPRKSFGIWREQVKSTALPWQEEELAELEIFRRFLIELELGRQIQSALQSNRELDEFAFVLAHDLKEPLRGIQAFIGFLQEDNAALPPGSQENIRHIQELSTRARKMISDLHEFSRLGKLELALSEVDPAALVAEVKSSLRHLIQERNALVEIEGKLPAVTCDPVRVREIFHNLIANAIVYNKSARPQVRVSAAEGSPTVFRVADNGIGIRPEDRERVFRLFERLNGRDQYPAGSGLGLAIVQRAVLRHQGRVWVEEGNPGTVFCFTLAPSSEGRNRGE